MPVIASRTGITDPNRSHAFAKVVAIIAAISFWLLGTETCPSRTLSFTSDLSGHYLRCYDIIVAAR